MGCRDYKGVSSVGCELKMLIKIKYLQPHVILAKARIQVVTRAAGASTGAAHQ
jgi:hypothetical protein